MLNVTNVQMLPVSISNFQWDRAYEKLAIGNIGIGNIITLATLILGGRTRGRNAVKISHIFNSEIKCISLMEDF